MRSKPPEIDEPLLVERVREHWGLNVESLRFEPLGAGSHHWIAHDESGERRFVTVDDLALKPWLGPDADAAFRGLKNAYEIARTLQVGGLDFVVAPMPTTRDELVVRLKDRFTIALFPLVMGRVGHFDDATEGEDRHAANLMWARLHAATPLVRSRADVRGFGVPCRSELETALHETDRRWDGGPLSEPARDWLASNRRWVVRVLSTFDDLAQRVAAKGRELVITHGEPHGANVIKRGAMRYLVDWDTVALALPERDLWRLDDGTAEALDRYADASGRPVDPECLAFYAVTWYLTDIALFVDLLHDRHVDDADSRAALPNLGEAAARLGPYIPR